MKAQGSKLRQGLIPITDLLNVLAVDIHSPLLKKRAKFLNHYPGSVFCFFALTACQNDRKNHLYSFQVAEQCVVGIACHSETKQVKLKKTTMAKSKSQAGIRSSESLMKRLRSPNTASQGAAHTNFQSCGI